MTWVKSAADRQRDQAAYGPAYRRNRAIARRRANGRCEQCDHKHARLEADHIVNLAQGGSNDAGNLRMLCKGPPCRCHDRKTAGEGNRSPARRAPDPEPLRRTAW